MCPDMDGIVARPHVKMPPIDNEKKNENRFEELIREADGCKLHYREFIWIVDFPVKVVVMSIVTRML